MTTEDPVQELVQQCWAYITQQVISGRWAIPGLVQTEQYKDLVCRIDAAVVAGDSTAVKALFRALEDLCTTWQV